MKTLADCNITEVRLANNQWQQVHDEQLEDGATIRVFYPDGSRKLINGCDTFVVMSEPLIQLVAVKYPG